MCLTFLEVVRLPDVDEYERHQLELGQALPGGGGDGQQVPQLVDLVVDRVPPHLARALRRLIPCVIAESNTVQMCVLLQCFLDI